MVQKMSKEILLVVDSSSLAVTIFYAMGGSRFLDAEEVIPTEVQGFLRTVAAETVANVQRRVSMDGFTQVRLALESPPWAPVWRYEKFFDYKYALSNPNKPKVAAKLQEYIIEMAEVVGVQTLFCPRMEADDVIAIMVERLQERLDTIEICIWSQDRDLHQLVTHDNIYMLGKRGMVTTRAQVEEYWGHKAGAIPLIKALAGDKSDNISGIRGLGPKGAAKLVRYTPYKKGGSFTLDTEALPERLRLEILLAWPKIQEDVHLCTLIKEGTLLSGTEYRR